MPSKPATSSFLPVLSLLFAATLWGVIWYPLRLLEHGGLGGVGASLVSYGAALIVGFAASWRARADYARSPLAFVALALVAGWCNVAFILSVLEGPVVRALLLFYLSPLWAALFGRLFLGEHLSRFALAVLALAMAGALVMLWNPDVGLPWPLSRADWLAISSGMSFALSNVLVRRLQAVSIPVKSVATWGGVVLVAGAWITLGGQPLSPVTLDVLAGAAVLGLLGIFFMTLAVQYGVTHMPVHRSAVILLFELVAGAASSLLLAHEAITAREWIGGLLIIAAAYFSARHAREP